MNVEELAQAHWDYVASVLLVHGANETEIEMCGHHYRTAFIHGWKHAIEYRDETDLPPSP